ncbi:helix-turn-helix domain-containing protein [Myxococcus sp. MxC21-1]|uniref:Transcriptional regulator, AlpA family n=2 Tax=Myxococcaceae TaxID=31 RepID=A0A511HJ86_9BACT|nr:helix-turn-helix domain-containing protein [Myxococcus virescens]WNZ59843.1 helix-turn-helix domain-containing protein [Myxococcus sp. MxC21-1]GEL73646.1 hypothetical protein MVI01_54300 [Myxococcus virescens]SDE53416.1 transcriptional regulator, AlpA family [Myxococcus virescens]
MGNCDSGSGDGVGLRAPTLTVVPEGGLWTAVETAAYLKVSPHWVWRQVRMNSGLPFIRLGRNVRFDPSKVRAWVASRSSGGTQ